MQGDEGRGSRGKEGEGEGEGVRKECKLEAEGEGGGQREGSVQAGGRGEFSGEVISTDLSLVEFEHRSVSLVCLGILCFDYSHVHLHCIIFKILNNA